MLETSSGQSDDESVFGEREPNIRVRAKRAACYCAGGSWCCYAGGGGALNCSPSWVCNG